jgi:hypothetical protein
MILMKRVRVCTMGKKRENKEDVKRRAGSPGQLLV